MPCKMTTDGDRRTTSRGRIARARRASLGGTAGVAAIAALTVTLAAATPARATTFNWDGGSTTDNNWSTIDNWGANGVPGDEANSGTTDDVRIAHNFPANPVNIDIDLDLYRLWLGRGSTEAYIQQTDHDVVIEDRFYFAYDHDATYTLGGGTFDLTGAGQIHWGSTGQAHFIQTGGTFTAPSFTLDHGDYTMSGGTLTADIHVNDGGLFSQSGGTTTGSGEWQVGVYTLGEIDISGTADVTLDKLRVAHTGHGIVNQTGGTFTVTGTMDMARSGQGEWTVTGGTANANFINIGDGNMTNQYTLTVGGSGAVSATDDGAGFTIASDGTVILQGSGTGGILTPGWHQNGGVLKPEIDAGGVIHIAVTGTADFDSALLDPEALAGAQAGTYTIVTYGVLGDTDLSFATGVDTNMWSFAFVDDDGVAGGAGELQLTLIPEPSSGALALLALGGLVVLPRRRKVTRC